MKNIELIKELKRYISKNNNKQEKRIVNTNEVAIDDCYAGVIENEIIDTLEYEVYVFVEYKKEVVSPLLYKAFKDKVKFLVAYLNKEKYQNQLKEELKTNINKYDNLIDKTTGKAKELKITIDGIKKRLDESNKYKEDMIPISAAMFMLYGSEISYLFSGSLEEYKNLYAQYLIQWYMIEFAVKNKYDTYNFFGISGIFDKKDKEYGVYEFKKGFGGNVVELIGDFDLPISIFYNINKIIKKFR